ALKEAAPNALGILDCSDQSLDVRVSRAQCARALRIADALVGAFVESGWEVMLEPSRTVVRVGEIPIRLAIEELMETVELPPKPHIGEGQYTFNYRREPDRIKKPSGHLSIRIEEAAPQWGHTQQRSWRESPTRRLEDLLNQVLVGMLKYAAAVEAD